MLDHRLVRQEKVKREDKVDGTWLSRKAIKLNIVCVRVHLCVFVRMFVINTIIIINHTCNAVILIFGTSTNAV